LEKFAAKRNFDPLVAENWYNINPKDITQEKVSPSPSPLLFSLLS
jgi:hypothetical protein